ncbi:MAG: amidohydrolase family protein [Actinomycetota bacterium]|nr:amidohydrolase family protein [Actinomycetota bacterium]
MSGFIDVHGHVVLEESMGAAGHVCGPELGYYPDGTTFFRVGDWRLDGVPYKESLFMQAKLRLEAMDEAGISLQALSPNPLTYLHWIDEKDAANYCRIHNEAMASLVSDHEDRFLGFASLPMQNIDMAINELEYSVKELNLIGGYIGTDFGTDFDDPRMNEFYAACCEFDVPLFLHPAPSGLDGPLRDPRMRKYDLDLVIEFSYEELVATSMIIFGGVTKRFPSLDICISHGGGSTMLHRSKLRLLAERRPSSPEWIREPGEFDKELDNLWFDCHVSGQMEFDFAMSQLNTDRLVFGTNFGGWDSGAAHYPSEMIEKLNTNAKTLLRLDAAT